MADHDPIDVDVHLIRPDTQRRGCNAVNVLASSRVDSEVGAGVRRRQVGALVNRAERPASSTG